MFPCKATQVPHFSAVELPRGLCRQNPAHTPLVVLEIQCQASIYTQRPQGLKACSIKICDNNAVRTSNEKHWTAVTRIWREEMGVCVKMITCTAECVRRAKNSDENKSKT